ncbi:DUF5057 domain-containing protein [Butyrivibrio sp. TB]|uniref:DUF5057 domain-containing protein n=1 Tax=Butyrivibrio sp. TB TaxID=1520809 RepID=UPI0008AFAC4B|nr:DUF5057 domain-containing protein [Butyrivibrio sp. TB]SEQ01153.1 protein of unknown function [Butyrivibrio sp. TB]
MKYTLSHIKSYIKKNLNKKVVKRRSAKVLATVVAGSVVAVLPFSSMNRSLAAADTFMDLNDRIAGSSDFSLVEIADDYEQASMGYFASGYEPFREYQDVKNQTDGYEYNPTVGIGDVVTALQEESIMSADPDAGETDYPMTYQLKAYNHGEPPYVIKDESGNPDDDYYILNAGAGLIGRELVPGYYVQSSSGCYYEDKSVIDIRDAKTSDKTDLEMTGTGAGIKATVVGKGNTITFSLPEGTVSDTSKAVIWTIGSTKIINVAEPTTGLVSTGKTKDNLYFFTGKDGDKPLTTITIKGLEFGNTYVSAKVVSLNTSEISQSNIDNIENRYVVSDTNGGYRIYNAMVTCAEPAAEIVYCLGISIDGEKDSDGNPIYYYKKINETENKKINLYIGKKDGIKLNAYIGVLTSEGKFKPVSNYDTGFVYTWTNDYYDNLDINTTDNTNSINRSTQTSIGKSITLKANAANKYTELSLVADYSPNNEYRYPMPDAFSFDVVVVDTFYAVYNYKGQIKAIDSGNSSGIPTITMSEDDYNSDTNMYTYTIKYLGWDENTSSFIELSPVVEVANISDSTTVEGISTIQLKSNGDNTYTLDLKPIGTGNAWARVSPEKTSVSDSDRLRFELNYISTVRDNKNNYYHSGDYIGVTDSETVETQEGQKIAYKIDLTASVINKDDMLNHVSKNSSLYRFEWRVDKNDVSKEILENNTARFTYTGSNTDYKVKVDVEVYNKETNTHIQAFDSVYYLLFNFTGETLLYAEYNGSYYNASKNRISSTNPIKVTNKDETAVITGCVGSVVTVDNEEVFVKKSGTYSYTWVVNTDTGVLTKLNKLEEKNSSVKLGATETGVYSFDLSVNDSSIDPNTGRFYISFSFYNVYSISTSATFDTEEEISGTYYPSEKMTSGTYYVGSSNENFEVKGLLSDFKTTLGESKSYLNYISVSDLNTYEGENPNIKTAKKLVVNLSESGILTLVLGPKNSDNTDDYLTLVFSSVILYKVNDIPAVNNGEAGSSFSLDSVDAKDGKTFKYTIGSNSASTKLEVKNVDELSSNGCTASLSENRQIVTDDPEIKILDYLTLEYNITGRDSKDYTIIVGPLGSDLEENLLKLTITVQPVLFSTYMYYSTYDSEGIDDIDDIDSAPTTSEEEEDLEAGDEHTVTMSLSEIANFVLETNMQVDIEQSFEVDENAGSGSNSNGGSEDDEDDEDSDKSSSDTDTSGGDNGSGGEGGSSGGGSGAGENGDSSGDVNESGGDGGSSGDVNESGEDGGSSGDDNGSEGDGGSSGGGNNSGGEGGDDSSDGQARLDNYSQSSDRLYMTATAAGEGGSGSGSGNQESSDNDGGSGLGSDDGGNGSGSGDNGSGSGSDGSGSGSGNNGGSGDGTGSSGSDSGADNTGNKGGSSSDNDSKTGNTADDSNKDDSGKDGSAKDDFDTEDDEDLEDKEGSGKSGSKDISGDTSVKESSVDDETYIYTLPIIPSEPGIYTITIKPAGSDDESEYITIKIVVIADEEDGESTGSKKSTKSSSSASTGSSDDEADAAGSASTESSADSSKSSSGSSDESTSSGSASTGKTSSGAGAGGSGSSAGGSGSGGSTGSTGSGGSSGSTGSGGNTEGSGSGDNTQDPSQDNNTDNTTNNNNNTDGGSDDNNNNGDGNESGNNSGGDGDGGSSGDSGQSGSANASEGSGSSNTINDQGTPASSEPSGLRHRNVMIATGTGTGTGTDTGSGTGSGTGTGTNTGSGTDSDTDEIVDSTQKYDNAKEMEGGYYVLSCAEDASLLSGVAETDRYNFSLTKPSSGNYFAGYGYAYYITINHDWLKYYVFGDDETRTDDNNVNLTLYLYTLCDTFDKEREGYNEEINDIVGSITDADLVYLSADGMTLDGKSAIGDGESDTRKIYDIPVNCARQILTSSYSQSGTTGVYPQAVIVNRSIYDNNAASALNSKASTYYALSRFLMTDIKDNIILNTPGLSSDDDGTFSSSLKGISNYTSFSTGGSNYEASKDVTKVSGAYNYKNIFIGKYNTGDFTSSFGVEYKNVPEVFNRSFAKTYTNPMISSGFEELLEFIIRENVYRGRKSIGNMSYTISPSVVVQYILIFSGSDLTLYKSSIRVLELEPCYAFKYFQYDDGGADVEYRQAQRAEVFAEKFAPNLSLLEDPDYMTGTFSQRSAAQTTILNRIKITGMTTSEFAGIIGDPCEDYDVIYIGSQTIDTAVYTYGVTNQSVTTYYYGIKNTTKAIMNIKDTTEQCTGMPETVTGIEDNNGRTWEWYVENKVSDSSGRWRLRNNKGNYKSNKGVPSTLSYTANDGTVYNWNGTKWYKTSKYSVYNSSNMNGILYTHVGDSMNDSAMYVDGADFGSVAVTHNTSVNLRLSGNDITSIQEKELENFLELGYPVIVSDDLFTFNTNLNGNGLESIIVPNGISAGASKLTTTSGTFAGRLDTNSQMYKFIKAGMGDSFSSRKYTNFVTETMGSKFTDLITEGLNKSKLTVDVTSVPTEYVAVTNGNILDPNQCVFLSPGSDGQYYLDFDFMITDVANPDLLDATYSVQLFLDSNGDGRFAGSTDETKSNDQIDKTFTEEIMNLSITGGSTTSLMPYTTYHLTRQLPNGYYGSVAWKLKITNNKPNSENASLCSHDSISGICAVIPSGVEERVEINVLQVFPYIPNSTSAGGGSDIAKSYDISGAVSRDISYLQYYNPSSDWYSMLENIPGYDVNIYSISSYDFGIAYEKNYDASKITEESDILEVELEGGHLVSPTTIAGNFNEAIDRNGDGDTDDANERPTGPTQLSSYDMIIVGFTDMFPNIPNENAVKSLVTYGKSGRAMLFTHDTTSWVYDTSGYGRAGLNANSAGKTYRQFVIQSQWCDWFASSYLSNAIRDLCGMDRFGYVGANNVYGSAYSTIYDPTPYLPNSGNALSGAYRLATTNHSIYGTNNAYKNLAVGGYTNRNSNKNAYYVSLVNEGTISKYPYDLEDEMFVASTHGQYFQLNLDMDNNADGESDITVWYTLDSRDMDTNGNGTVEPGEHVQNFVSTYTKNGANDVYEASPHDVRNNYYIYNRGNISYSGVGHSAVTQCTTPEVQLFINTMIMAYNSGVKAASISITDEAFSKELTTDKLPYDAYAQELYVTDEQANTAINEEGDTVDSLNVDAYYPVYFSLTDLNVGIKTQNIRVNFSYGKRSQQYTNYNSETGTYALGPYGASYSSSTTPATPYPAYLCADTNGNGIIEDGERSRLTAEGDGYYRIYNGELTSNAFVTYYIEVDIPIYDLNNNGSGVAMGESDTLDVYVHAALTGEVNGVTSTVHSTDSMSLLRQELYDLD